MKIDRGSWAIVTGASGGLGAEFARQLAARGCRLVLTSRDGASMERVAAELPVETARIALDLSDPDSPAALFRFTEDQGIVPDLLVNNAGFGSHGRFDRLDPESERAMIRVNVEALAALTGLYLPGMVERGRGAVLLVASTAGFFPLPYMATYAATKAFVIAFGQALWKECRARGVLVSTFAPGTTRTRFQERAGLRGSRFGPSASAAAAVREALRGIERGRRLVVPGAANRFSASLRGIVPVRAVLDVVGSILDPDQAEVPPTR